MRLIDADALMRKAVELFYTTNYFNHISKMIEDAPTASEWIPVSERLPLVQDGDVLAVTTWGDITIACRLCNDNWFIHEGNSNATTKDLVAWMPLPELYKVGDTE